jgi:hypothetical protein
MRTLHVVCDRGGRWTVVDEARAQSLSEHETATEAERAALRLTRGTVMVRDRYGRTRTTQHPRAHAEQPLAH